VAILKGADKMKKFEQVTLEYTDNNGKKMKRSADLIKDFSISLNTKYLVSFETIEEAKKFAADVKRKRMMVTNEQGITKIYRVKNFEMKDPAGFASKTGSSVGIIQGELYLNVVLS
jgi:hypothetical protein